MTICAQCGSETKNPKFCNRSCAATYTGKHNVKRKRIKQCYECGELIRSEYKFCGEECRKAHHSRRPKRSSEEVKAANVVGVIRWRQRLKERAVAYKGGKCFICAYNRCVAALDFHHLDPNLKSFSISSDGHARSWEKVKDELDKCVLLCATCHREVEVGFTVIDPLSYKSSTLDC